MMKTLMIIIVDFGSQTAHLIGRRLRQLGIQVRYLDPSHAVRAIKDNQPRGIILTGGPANVYGKDAPNIDQQLFELNLPVLGICYGWQLMAKMLGGRVKSTTKEYGPSKFKIPRQRTGRQNSKLKILKNLPSTFTVWLSHGDTVVKLPQGFEVFGSTKDVKAALVADLKRKIYGVQFHPEADHTEYGLELLKNFAHRICGEDLNPLSLNPEEIINKIKQVVGDQKVICAVSGGVDSTISAFLIGKAIGQNLIPVHVESGLMRPETLRRVKNIFSQLIPADLVVVEAKKRFIKALQGITDPEEKRKTIGKLYVGIFHQEAQKHQDATFLGQGTIYSDVIESKGSKRASKIKSHHNVGGLPKKMKLKLLEPVRDYYKDEVRQLGRLTGLPDEIINQQPFPGPGYAIRIRGEVNPFRLKQVKMADSIVMEEMKNAKLLDQVFQCFAVLSGAYSTAVKGDARVFAEVVVIRAYQSRDIMTSNWSPLPYDLLQKMSSRIVNEVPRVSRVVYDITTKPPATMEWE